MEYAQLPENRRHARVAQDAPIRILDLASRVADNNAEVLDASRKGFSLRSRLPLEAGDRLAFCLPLPNGGLVRGDAMVRWSRPQNEVFHMVGLDIVRIGFWHRLRLNQYLAPRGTGLLRFLDASLEAAFSLLLLFFLKQIIFSDAAARGFALQALPFALLVAAPAAAVCALSRKR